MWVVTSSTRPAKQGSSRNEKWSRRSSRNHGLTWTHGDTQGLPHIHLDCTVVEAMRRGQEQAKAAAQAERTKTSKYGRAKGGVAVTGGGVQASNQQSSRWRRRTATARVAKTSERSAGEVHRRDNPLGHRAQGLGKNVVRTGLVSFVPFG